MVASGATAALEVQLEAAGVQEQVTVTPTGQEQQLGLDPAPASALITQEEIQRRPAMVPGRSAAAASTFSLFRRSEQPVRASHQSKASRCGHRTERRQPHLVLLDGVPFDDPFGGWVYWTALPMESAERIEVVNGASSSLYGSYAMGGVLNVVTRRRSGVRST